VPVHGWHCLRCEVSHSGSHQTSFQPNFDRLWKLRVVGTANATNEVIRITITFGTREGGDERHLFDLEILNCASGVNRRALWLKGLVGWIQFKPKLERFGLTAW
jgi:hypothetical protein